ncbi:hypothetical protein [Sphingomonas fuzhouensis]|uniref:hypothetical protein n=1 Tax=Sphingomonas fuzhouensis TaxID=3106033 RepID=UPI002AFF609B|nr:hypothetical protein [Sphingomonas sp. SGZ-02]
MLFMVLALQAAPASVPAATPPKDKIICKKIQETGSFLKTHKTCLTAQQWRRSSENNQGAARGVVGAGTGIPGANTVSGNGE